jgi:ABC-type bacteriocin/lantibiotic exporter with double-glycine peptidase domain
VIGARLAALAVTLAGAGPGCVSHGAGGQPVDPARIAGEPGWIAARATPEVRQRDDHDCGAAALAMVAGRFGVPLTLSAAIRAIQAPAGQGARLGQLRGAARSLGLVAFAVRGERQIVIHELRAGRPVIVGLLTPHGRRVVRSHYEVVVAVRPASSEIVTLDPSAGWRVRLWDEFDAEWEAAGRPALIVLGTAARVDDAEDATAAMAIKVLRGR